jgi:hypothetical protein
MEEKDMFLQIQQIAHELSLNDDELQNCAENFGMNVPQYRHYLWLRYKTENEKLGTFYWCQPESNKSKRAWLSFAAAILAICCIGLSIVFCYYNGKSMYQKGEAAGYEQGIADTKSKYSASNSSGVKVYVTPSGSRYHEKGCDYLSDKAFQISLKEAKKNGYTACSKCNPPK